MEYYELEKYELIRNIERQMSQDKQLVHVDIDGVDFYARNLDDKVYVIHKTQFSNRWYKNIRKFETNNINWPELISISIRITSYFELFPISKLEKFLFEFI